MRPPGREPRGTYTAAAPSEVPGSTRAGSTSASTVSIQYENPALTVDAVWIHRGRVLLIRRARPPFQGQWALPGGFVELRETVEGAVARELEEETGLSARPWKLVGVYSGAERDPRKPTTTVAFLMRGRAGPPRAGDDARRAEWVALRDAHPLAFDHAQILRDGLRLWRGDRRGRRRRGGGHDLPARPRKRRREREDRERTEERGVDPVQERIAHPPQ